jgi:hypothetical protein
MGFFDEFEFGDLGAEDLNEDEYSFWEDSGGMFDLQDADAYSMETFDEPDEWDLEWDWMTSQEDTIEPFKFEEMSLDFLDDEEGGGAGISSGVWSKLLDFGLGSLGQWLENKNKKPTTKRSGGGGGGGGGPAPVASVKKAIPVGTRTKG